MNTPDDLETQLREHYAGKASELRLPDVTLDDVLARGDAPLTAAAPGSTRRGWIAGSVAAALVAGAVVGAGVVLVTDDDPRPASRPTVLPQTEPTVAPGGAGGPFMSCPAERVPDDVAVLDLTNDIRVAHVLLPSAPSDWCVVDHGVTTFYGRSGAEFVVYSSCVACDSPTASVAEVHPFENLEATYEDENADPVELDVSGHPARFYAPDESSPIGRLYVDVGADAPYTLMGWGLDGEGMGAVAAALLADERVPEDAEEQVVPGLVFAYGGLLGPYWPGGIPMTTTLSVSYGTAEGEGIQSYSVMQYPDQAPLEAFAWARPDASFATIDGRRTLTFPPSASFAGTEETTVMTEVDDNTTVVWSANGTPPMPAEELAAIELTPAAPDDPRWLEIAYESGHSDALG